MYERVASSHLLLLVALYFFVAPVRAFGAGDIPKDSGFDGYVWRHGDISNLLKALPASFLTQYALQNWRGGGFTSAIGCETTANSSTLPHLPSCPNRYYEQS